jgi:heptosyltransferase-2
VTSAAACELLLTNPYVGRILEISSLDGRLAESYDLVVSLDEDLAACELASSLRGRSRLVGAFLRGSRPDYTADSASWFDMSRISRLSRAAANRLKRLNERTYPELIYEIVGLRYERQEPLLTLTPEAAAFGAVFAAAARIGPDDLVFGVNTGAGPRWQDKRLGVEETAVVVEALSREPGSRVLLLGGPGERARNRDIAECVGCPVEPADGADSVLEFAALLNLCRVVVTSDSLALHLAVALRRRVVAFFYPTSAAEIELYGRGAKIIGRGRSYCSYERVCRHPPVWDLQAIVESARRFARE